MKSIVDFIKWIAAVIATGALLVAVPVVFLLAPSPLDSDRGVKALVDAVVNGTQIFDESVVSLVVAVGWVLWAYLAASFVLEVVSAALGAASRNVRGMSFGQSIARPLVGALMWSTTASTVAMSVIGAGGVAVATTQIAHAAEAPSIGANRSLNLSEGGHVYVMNNDDIEDGSTLTDPIVISEDDGTVLVDGQLLRPHLVVIKDDTMWDLAETHLQDPFRWTEIAELNLGRPQPNSPVVTDPDLIWPGTVLLMPGDAIGLNTPPPPPEEPPVEEEASASEEDDCDVAPIEVWTPETDAARDATNGDDDSAVPEPDSIDRDEVATVGRDEFSLGTELPWWWLAAAGGAGAVFAAGMVRLIAQRRDRDQALGLGVEEFVELDELLDEFDEPQSDLRSHLLSAVVSLRENLVGVDAPMLQVDADKTTAVFTEVVRPADGSVWSLSAEDGERAVWELLHPELASFDRDASGSALYGVGDNMFLNLEALGWLGIEGEPDLVASHLRHLVHDLVGNFGQQHELVLRVGGPGMIMGADVYNSATEANTEAMRAEVSEYIRQTDEAHTAFGTNLAAELRNGEGLWPTLVLVLDLEEVDYLAAIIEPLHRFPGRYPISVVSVGVSSGAPWLARINSPAEMVIDTAYFSNAPRVKPLLMTESTAEALAAELRGQLSTKRWEPAAPAPTEPVVVVAEHEAELDWFDNVMDEYIDEPTSRSASSEGECLMENPLPGHRVPYDPPTRELNDIVNPSFTPEQFAEVSDVLSDRPTEVGSIEEFDEDEDLDDDDEVAKVMAAQPVERPQLQLLGRPAINGVAGSIADRALATAALLALAPEGLDRSQIREHIWDGRQVDMRQIRKVLSDIERSVGMCLGRVVNNNSPITLRLDTDIDEIERRISTAKTQPWNEASVVLAETLELLNGEPLEGVANRNWWHWVDREGGQIRRQLIERVEVALGEAGAQAQAKNDWQLATAVGHAGIKVAPLSQRMVGLAAFGTAMSGDSAAAMALVTQWEDDYEAAFDVEAPAELRTAVSEATQHRLTG